MTLAGRANGFGGIRIGARGPWWGSVVNAEPRPARVPYARARPDSDADAYTASQLENVWDRHGGSVYALACALVGDDAAAGRAVALAMIDLALSTRTESPEDALRPLAAHVYRRCQEVSGEPFGRSQLPPVMAWLGNLAQLQRACLALCVFGGHTHREAADLLGVPAETVAEMLTTGLRELGHLAAGGTVDRTIGTA